MCSLWRKQKIGETARGHFPLILLLSTSVILLLLADFFDLGIAFGKDLFAQGVGLAL